MVASMSTRSSSARAACMAASSSLIDFTFVTPTLDPARAGFTNTGNPSCVTASRTVSGWFAQSKPVTVRHGATSIPAASMTVLAKCLSMPTLEASTPDPT